MTVTVTKARGGTIAHHGLTSWATRGGLLILTYSASGNEMVYSLVNVESFFVEKDRS